MGKMLHKQKPMPATTSTYAEALAKFTFTEGPDGRFRATAAEARPGAMAQPGDRLRYVDLPSLLADPAVGSERRAAYQKLYDRGVKALLALGADAKGLTIVRP